MARQKSIWKITFDPGGTPLVLCDYGDFLLEVLKTTGSNRVDTTEPLEGASIVNYAREQVSREKSFSVFKDHATFVAAANYAEQIDSILPLGTVALLKVEIQGGGTTTYASAAFVNWSTSIVRGNTFQTLTEFRLKCGKATVV
jgi:hypothetical protein